MKRILVIEDDKDIASLVSMHLQDHGSVVDIEYDGRTGLDKALENNYSLIILDLMLPSLDGLEICKRLRQESQYTPILMLTARTTEMDRIIGLELGADDYLTKPFSIGELVARAKAICRRMASIEKNQHSNQSINTGELSIDHKTRSVTLNNKSVELTAKEFDLLWHFAQHPGQVFTRTQLLDSVWGYSHSGYEHTVNSHINRLRAKIEKQQAKPQYILTAWGVGYKFAH